MTLLGLGTMRGVRGCVPFLAVLLGWVIVAGVAGAQEAPDRGPASAPLVVADETAAPRPNNAPPPEAATPPKQTENGGAGVLTLSGTLFSVDESGKGPPYLTYKTPFEFHLTLITAALGVFLVLVLAWMARKTGITDGFVRSFMVVTIVFGALFLIVAGYSDKQTAPVFGLLGTIVGYIFGRSEKNGAVEDVVVAPPQDLPPPDDAERGRGGPAPAPG